MTGFVKCFDKNIGKRLEKKLISCYNRNTLCRKGVIDNMTQADIDLMGNHLKKLYKAFASILCVISAIELFLIIRGIMIFDLTRQKHRMYLYSYVFLFIASIVTLVVVQHCKKRKKHKKMMIIQSCIYTCCLVVWSAFVSMVDCVANGDSGIMVFAMTALAAPGTVRIKPSFFIPSVTVSGAAMAATIWAVRGEPYSMGFYINFVLLILLSCLVSVHSYGISKREFEAHKKLKSLSYTDQLTGIYNRRQLDKQIEKCILGGRACLFILIDVDNFKKVNDSFGHAVGDDCLILIAEKLKKHFGDGVYRFGGDEFAVICELDAEMAGEAVDVINTELKGAYDGVDLHISAGMYRLKQTDTAQAVFICTDRALYRAKDHGKCGWVVYDEG